MMSVEMNEDHSRRVEKKIAAMSLVEFQKWKPDFSEQQAQERIDQAKAFVGKLPYNPLQDELDYRRSDPEFIEMTMANLNQHLKDLGYRLERSSDCHSVSRYMTGPRAGKSYPCVSMRLVQADDGMGFSHYQARRDSKFKALQEMRGRIYVVGRNAIYEM